MKKNADSAAPDGTTRRIWFARHKIATVILSVAIVGLAVGGYFGVKMWNAFNDPASALIADTPTPAPATETPDATAAPTDISETPTPVPTPTPEPELQTARNDVNILMLGVALGLGRDDTGDYGQTDCIILVHIKNLKANEKPELTMMSIPRDTLIATMYDKEGNQRKVDNGAQRVNTAYRDGGLEGAKKTISHYLGDITIDKYVLFDMDFVVAIIDAVGGVDVPVKDLSSKTVKVKTNGVVYTFENNTTMHMGGMMALTYARDRHDLGMGDYVRGDHMQDVMKALLDKLKDKGNLMSHAWELYQTFSTQLTTDIDSYEEIAAFAGIAMRMDTDKISSPKIIRYDDMHMFQSSSVFFSDPDTKKKVIKDVFGIDYTMPKEETYSVIMAPINKVINSTKKTIDTAKAYLADKTGKYTTEEAQPLNDAIKAWENAKFNKDSKKLQNTEKVVKAKYTDFKTLVDPR